MKNLYMPEPALVEDITEETPNIRTLTIRLEKARTIRPMPGQFIELTVFGHGEFPVSVSRMVGTDGDCFQTTVQRIGKVTTETGRLIKGSWVGIRGPFGNGFPLAEMRGKDICIITGGVGLAAVSYLVRHIMDNRGLYGKLQLLHGAKTPDDIIYKDSLLDRAGTQKLNIDILLAVDRPDQTWHGHVGVVTGLIPKALEPSPNTMAVICGPAVMMRSASEGLSAQGFSEDRILLSLERRMHCGIGMCGHCTIGVKQVCLDGPIFTYATIKNTLEKIF